MFKSLLLIVTVVAGFAVAQTGVPLCATGCITLPAQCNNDPGCICKDTTWISQISCCVFTACNAADQAQALAYAQQICTPVGASLPTHASCGNSTTNSTTSAASSSSQSATASASAASASASRAGGAKIGAEGILGLFAVGAALL